MICCLTLRQRVSVSRERSDFPAVTGPEGNCREKVPTASRGETKDSPLEEPQQGTKSPHRLVNTAAPGGTEEQSSAFGLGCSGKYPVRRELEEGA